MSRFGSALQNFILGSTIAAVVSLLPPLAVAQPDSRAPDSAAAPAEKPNDADALQVGDKFFNTKKFLNLTVGVEHDEPIPEDWPKWKPSGSYKKYFNVSVEKDNRSLLRFTPTSEGYSVFYIRDKRNDKVLREYRITVKKSKLDNVVREIQALLGDIEGINIKIVNNRVVVDGQILLPRDLGRIHSVLSQFPDQASTLVTMSPLAMKRIADKIREDINNPEITVRSVNDKLILEGVAADEGERDNAELIAKTYLPDLVIDSAEATGVIRKRKPANDGVINLIIATSSALSKLI
jgi:pilus assembly protein CpaC